jgi:hypothetical protein
MAHAAIGEAVEELGAERMEQREGENDGRG